MRKEDGLVLQDTIAETPRYKGLNPTSRVIVIRDKNKRISKKSTCFSKGHRERRTVPVDGFSLC
jgi:hypothetical protein